MRTIALCLFMTCLAASPVVAQQNPPDLKISAGQPYRHDPSGLVIPVMLDGLVRTRATAFAPDHLDEAFNFESTDTGEDITIFVFRNVTGSVSVWFDRTAHVVEHRDVYGGLAPVTPATAFVPPEQNNASAMLATYRPIKSRYRSTALAYIPLGPGWYVEVRYSSSTIAPDAIRARLEQVIATLGWPKRIEPQPAAVVITDCPTNLALRGRASAVSGDNALGSALLAGLLVNASLRGDAKTEKSTPPAQWCRDPGRYPRLAAHGVYRVVGTDDQYLIAYQDAGRGVLVAPDAIAGLLQKKGEKETKSWSVAEYDVASVSAFANRDRLPPPEQAAQIVASEPFTTRTATWGNKHNVQVNSSAVK